LNIDFRPSSGWIDGLKKLSGLVYRKVCGEANSVNPEEVAGKDTTLLHLMAKYSPKDIFNVMNLACSTICYLTKHIHSKEQAAKA
jgi:hypothetical protein